MSGISRRDKLVMWSAALGIGTWLVILGTLLFWMLQPANLPSVVTPIPILNENNEIAVGERIILELNITKEEAARTLKSDRFLECESGNLVTLTSATSDIPPGKFTIISDSVVLPNKVLPGDVCVFTYRNTYEINHLRSETISWSSEPFTVLAARTD